MSVKPPKAENARRRWHFRYVPLADIAGIRFIVSHLAIRGASVDDNADPSERVVQGNVVDIKVSEPRVGRKVGLAVHKEWHFLLCYTPVGSKRPRQA